MTEQTPRSPKGQIIGYVRVSSTDQNEARQLAAIGEVDRLFTEKVSARKQQREQLDELITYVREGDLVRVKDIDRLARSTRDLLALIDALKTKGVDIEFVDQPMLNTNSPHGELVLTILAAIAQFEWFIIKERQAEGIAIAKTKGVYNKAPKLTPQQVHNARQRIQDGVPKTRVAKDLGVSRQTLHSALTGTGVYANPITTPLGE